MTSFTFGFRIFFILLKINFILDSLLFWSRQTPCDQPKQTAQYTGKQPDEGSVVTSWDTAAAENEVQSSGHTHRKSMLLKDTSARTRTTRQATQTQPLLLAADAPFAAALEVVPEDWCRNWAAGRTIMLRRTSKRVKEIVDKMHLPAVVRLSRSFWDDVRNGTTDEKMKFVMRQLALLTGWPHQHTRATALWNERTRCREPYRSAGAVPSAGAP